MTITYTAPTNCSTVLGFLEMFNGGFNSAQISIPFLGLSCNANAGSSCTIPDVPFGTYTIEVTTNCTPQISNIAVDSQIQNGNGTLVFIVTTNSSSPNIGVSINCT